MRSIHGFLVAAALLMALSGSAHAQQLGPRIPQQYGPGLRPTLSPYLNLLRGGDAASNYYLGVRTEFQRRDDRANLLTRTRELEDRTAQIEGQEEENIIGGTPSDFGDTRGYFAAPNTYYGRANPVNINQGRPMSRQQGVR